MLPSRMPLGDLVAELTDQGWSAQEIAAWLERRIPAEMVSQIVSLENLLEFKS